MLPDVRVARVDRLGNDGNTLRAIVEGGGARVKALLFRAGDGPVARALEDGASGLLHVAGTLRAETWQGRESVSFFSRMQPGRRSKSFCFFFQKEVFVFL